MKSKKQKKSEWNQNKFFERALNENKKIDEEVRRRNLMFDKKVIRRKACDSTAFAVSRPLEVGNG